MLFVLTVVVGGVLSAGVGVTALLVQLAAQPVLLVAQSERNSSNKAPPLDVIVPGLFVPVYRPISGAEVVDPSYINK